MMRNRLLFVALILLSFHVRADAQLPGPPPPKEYQVVLRYRIHAGRTERLRQYFALVEFLARIDFQKEPGPDNEPEDSLLNRMAGKISSANARRLLDEPHIRSILLLPPDFKMPGPDEENNPIKVQLELTDGFPGTQQRLLWEQVLAHLRQFDFKPASAFDHRNFTRVVGTVRGGDLEMLLKDIRGLPTGWLAPLRPIADLPAPLREVSPIRVIEVIPEPEGVAPLKEVPPPADLPEHLQKITPDLRTLIDNKDEAAKPRRLEVILAATPNLDSPNWQRELIAAVPQLVAEGRMGPVATVLMAPEKAPDLAASPLVSTIRLPRTGAPLPMPGSTAPNLGRAALAATGLDRLHSQGQRGKGVRVGVIAGDFRGWEALVKSKQLPATTRLIDLTAARNTTVEPDPYPEDGQKQGHGTQCALAVVLAAPQADLLLIRVDPAAPYQVLAIARFINGEKMPLEFMDQRRDDLGVAFDDLQNRWLKFFEERRALLNDFNPEPEAVQKREAHAKQLQQLKDEEKDYSARLQRLFQNQRDLRELQRLRVVVNTLNWPDGHPVDGSSPLTQYLTNYPSRTTYWFQAAGDTRSQVWTGPFRDADRNGIMEFAPPGTPLPRDRWTHELNFVAWRKFAGEQTPEVPAKATLRFTVQWREAHDPQFLLNGEDLYREPLAKIQAKVLRQRDPSYQKLPADDMELIAYSYGLPQRIDNQPGSATYEQVVEFIVPEAGVYALRVDGTTANDIRPPSAPGIPATRKEFELRLRVFVEALDADSRAQGRPIFVDYRTSEGAIAMPGDSRSIFTIGAAGKVDEAQLYSATGPAFNLQLLTKPNLLIFDDLGLPADDGKNYRGTSIAASFAAGLTASALGAGIPPNCFLTDRQGRGNNLRIPDYVPVLSPRGR